jgi:hypothetical protein
LLAEGHLNGLFSFPIEIKPTLTASVTGSVHPFLQSLQILRTKMGEERNQKYVFINIAPSALVKA